MWVINMLPHLTSKTLVLLRTESNGMNSAIGEIGVIKCLDDYFRHAKSGNALCAIAGDVLVWNNPEFIEHFVEDQVSVTKVTALSSTDDGWAPLNDPDDLRLDYEMEIFASTEGILLNNKSVLEDIAGNYCIENWEVVRSLPGLMVLSVKGARVNS